MILFKNGHDLSSLTWMCFFNSSTYFSLSDWVSQCETIQAMAPGMTWLGYLLATIGVYTIQSNPNTKLW